MNTVGAFGPLLTPRGVTFQLWAPGARQVELISDQRRTMHRSGDDGWFKIEVVGARAGTRYRFRIDDQIDVPDPASRFQPDDVHGPSEVIDPETYRWQTRAWAGRPWRECSILELHIGTFTVEGSFRAAIEKLDHVAATGFTAIELMPVADFPGRWNWGYDGVLLYAPDSAYGRPDDLKALVDAAHAHGLMVFLDVVYNHFGPDGNYLGRYAPSFFSETHTPWGLAIDYRNPWVRRFAVDNALHWLKDYRFDGLRLDAVHAIAEPSRTTLLRELSEAAGRFAAASHRQIHLVLENDANQASLLDPVTDPAQGRYRAQWNDDYHHAFHVLLTGESSGYYGDYRAPQRHLARTLAQGFAYQGEPSPHRSSAPRGEATSGLPNTAFVNFLQNHDQIGNRALGERLSELTTPAALECALAVTLLSPAPPLMFMGDEWGSRQPFPFFCDFKGDLADAVRNGRRREFADAYAREGDTVPDPLMQDTVRRATLDWSAPNEPAGAARLDFVRRLLAARKTFIIPRLPHLVPGHGEAELHGNVLTARWRFGTGEALSLVANLSDRTQPRPPIRVGKTIWGDDARNLAPWSVHAGIEAP
jgi:malto-oligosyltrehalose trehalohydrolase